MRLTISVLVLATVLCLSGCGKTASTEAGPTATVTLTDGSKFTGEVTKTDVSEITLRGPNGESRTYPMSQVAGVMYAPAGGPPAVGVTSNAKVPGSTTTTSTTTTTTTTKATTSKAVPTRASAPNAPPAPEFRTLPAGTTLRIRNNEPINSDTARAGQLFSAVVAEDVMDEDGQLAIPKGADAELVVRAAQDQGKMQGRSELVLDVDSVIVNGHRYAMETGNIVRQGKDGVGTNKRTAIYAGGGSALGGIIGAIAGGGKGAAIGALSGAGAGTAAQAITRGKAVRVAAETVLTFKLDAPVRIRELR